MNFELTNYSLLAPNVTRCELPQYSLTAEHYCKPHTQHCGLPHHPLSAKCFSVNNYITFSEPPNNNNVTGQIELKAYILSNSLLFQSQLAMQARSQILICHNKLFVLQRIDQQTSLNLEKLLL
jgi:hypothetical protein